VIEITAFADLAVILKQCQLAVASLAERKIGN
jgi:hypothetical protein